MVHKPPNLSHIAKYFQTNPCTHFLDKAHTQPLLPIFLLPSGRAMIHEYIYENLWINSSLIISRSIIWLRNPRYLNVLQ